MLNKLGFMISDIVVLLINQGASIILVSKYLGHSDVSMTLNRYTHMYKSELENVTNLLNNL